MLNILSMRACASHSSLSSLSSLVSGIGIGFMGVGCWITTSGLFPFGSWIGVASVSAGSGSSSASERGSCSRSEISSPSGSSVSVLIDCLEADLEGYMDGFTLKGPNSGFWLESLLEVLEWDVSGADIVAC